MEQPAEVVIFSDIHVHAFNAYRTEVPFEKANGIYNSRLIDTVRALWQVADYAIEHNIKNIWFGGDMFHIRKMIATNALHLVYDCLKYMSDHGIKVTMIPGNHDYKDKDGHQNSIQTFDAIDNVTVETEVVLHEGDDVSLVLVPYEANGAVAAQDLAQAKELAQYHHADGNGTPLVLLAHLGIQGAKVGSDYVLVSDGDINVDDIPYKDFTACFFGHFHQHQKVFPNGWFVGALTQHNWGDAGGKRGFLHVKLWKDKVDFKRIETEAPKFRAVKWDDKHIPVLPNDFVKYTTNEDITPDLYDRLKKTLDVTHLDLFPEETEEEEFKLSVDKLDPFSMLSEWVKIKGKEDDKELLDLGKEILAEAKEKAS